MVAPGYLLTRKDDVAAKPETGEKKKGIETYQAYIHLWEGAIEHSLILCMLKRMGWGTHLGKRTGRTELGWLTQGRDISFWTPSLSSGVGLQDETEGKVKSRVCHWPKTNLPGKQRGRIGKKNQ